MNSEFLKEIRYLKRMLEKNQFPHPIEYKGLGLSREKIVFDLSEKLKSNDKELRKLGKSYYKIELNTAIKFHDEVKIKLNDFKQKYNYEIKEYYGKKVGKGKLQFIKKIEEDRESVFSMFCELRDYISDLFELALVFFPEIFKNQKNVILMQNLLPEDWFERRSFEKDIVRGGGRKAKETELIEWFNNRSDYYRLIYALKKEFKGESATVFFIMLQVLIEQEILNESLFNENFNSFYNAFKNEYGNIGSLSYYYTLIGDSTLLRRHEGKKKSIEYKIKKILSENN